eukprot:jgi/Chlat1/8883/Chrsp92S08202
MAANVVLAAGRGQQSVGRPPPQLLPGAGRGQTIPGRTTAQPLQGQPMLNTAQMPRPAGQPAGGKARATARGRAQQPKYPQAAAQVLGRGTAASPAWPTLSPTMSASSPGMAMQRPAIGAYVSGAGVGVGMSPGQPMQPMQMSMPQAGASSQTRMQTPTAPRPLSASNHTPTSPLIPSQQQLPATLQGQVRPSPSPLGGPPHVVQPGVATYGRGQPYATPMVGAVQRPAVPVARGGGRIQARKRIQDLVAQVDKKERLDPDVEEVLLDIADGFIETVTSFACALARHRRSETLEAKDLLLHLERNWQMRIPGFGGEDIRPYRKPTVNDAHRQRLAMVRRSFVASAQADAAAAGNVGSASQQQGAGDGNVLSPKATPAKSQRTS